MELLPTEEMEPDLIITIQLEEKPNNLDKTIFELTEPTRNLWAPFQST